jgi:uncharacterized protein YqgC (DUF456 family)
MGPPSGPVGPPPELPGATAGLVLGICSIVFSGPLIGVLLGFLGLTKAKEAKQFQELNPGIYANAGVAQAGYVCSIIGLVLGAFTTLCGCGYVVIIVVALMGAAAQHGGV